MMKILVTGFDPFGGEKVNPAYEAVKLLPDKIGEAKIIKLEIPTSFNGSKKAMEEVLEIHRPDVVISVGQAGGRAEITPEWVAINLAEARITDNDGYQPVEITLEADGPAAYFATIPVKAMVRNIRAHGLPSHISYTAGTYVCNSVMYRVLHMAATKYPRMRAGFIHVPYAMEQLLDKPSGTPGMSLRDIAKALEYAIEAVVSDDVLCNAY